MSSKSVFKLKRSSKTLIYGNYFVPHLEYSFLKILWKSVYKLKWFNEKNCFTPINLKLIYPLDWKKMIRMILLECINNFWDNYFSKNLISVKCPVSVIFGFLCGPFHEKYIFALFYLFLLWYMVTWVKIQEKRKE